MRPGVPDTLYLSNRLRFPRFIDDTMATLPALLPGGGEMEQRRGDVRAMNGRQIHELFR
jgi:hypothetical protein